MPKTMNPKYMPYASHEKLGYLIEECGEVLAAAGKTLRCGPESCNPELPPAQQETNRDWLLRELEDLERAIGFVRQDLHLWCDGDIGSDSGNWIG